MLIRGAHLILGDGSQIVADVLIENDRIVRISTEPIDAPGDQIIEASGKTVIPGLIDAHLHVDYLGVRNILSAVLRTRRHAATLRELLHNGVTSVRTMADPLTQIKRLRKKASASRGAGPHMIIAGPAITAPGGHPEVTVCRGNPWLRKHMVRSVADEAQARAVVRALHSDGIDQVKIVVQGGHYAEFGDELGKLSVDAIRGVLDEAHALGLKVSAHTHYQDDVDLLLGLGVDSIEHGVIETDIDDTDGFLQRWAESGVPLVSTLVIDQLVHNESGEAYLATASRNLSRAHEAGVRIAAGTDSMAGAMSAGSLHEELRLLVDAGLSPSAALQAATGNAADPLELPDRGRIEEGAIADLLVLNANPLEDIGATADLALVIQQGRIVHQPASRAKVELIEFAVGDEPVQHFADTTGGAFDEEVAVAVDSSEFSSTGLRTVVYTDPDIGAVLRTETLRSDSTLVTREWTCRIPADGTDLVARRVGQQVELTGTFRNAEVAHTYPLRGHRWLQGMFFDLATFLTGTGETLDFVAIGTTGRGALQASEFELTRTVRSADAGTERSVAATLVMPKWRRWWSAEIESDAVDGCLLRARTGRDKEITRVRTAPGSKSGA